MHTKPTFDDLGVTVYDPENRDILTLDVEEVIRLFKQEGLVVFADFDVDTLTFERFTDKFSHDYMDHKGGGSLRQVINKDGDQTILSVSYAYNPAKDAYDSKAQRTFPLYLHSDRSYTKSQPPLMWFYCNVPSAEDGETIVADGVDFWEALGERTRNLFRSQPIRYIRHYRDGEWQRLYETTDIEDVRQYCRNDDLTLTVDPAQSVTTSYVCHACVTPKWSERKAFVNSMLLVLWQEEELGRQSSLIRMEDGSKIPQWALDDVRAVAESKTREINWKPGHIAMIDNTRMLHGRRGFCDPNREIYVRMGRSVEW